MHPIYALPLPNNRTYVISADFTLHISMFERYLKYPILPSRHFSQDGLNK